MTELFAEKQVGNKNRRSVFLPGLFQSYPHMLSLFIYLYCSNKTKYFESDLLTSTKHCASIPQCCRSNLNFFYVLDKKKFVISLSHSFIYFFFTYNDAVIPGNTKILCRQQNKIKKKRQRNVPISDITKFQTNTKHRLCMEQHLFYA